MWEGECWRESVGVRVREGRIECEKNQGSGRQMEGVRKEGRE